MQVLTLSSRHAPAPGHRRPCSRSLKARVHEKVEHLFLRADARQNARGTGGAYVVLVARRTKFSINTGTKFSMYVVHVFTAVEKYGALDFKIYCV
jgi:hypothetical protein